MKALQLVLVLALSFSSIQFLGAQELVDFMRINQTQHNSATIQEASVAPNAPQQFEETLQFEAIQQCIEEQKARREEEQKAALIKPKQ